MRGSCERWGYSNQHERGTKGGEELIERRINYVGPHGANCLTEQRGLFLGVGPFILINLKLDEIKV